MTRLRFIRNAQEIGFSLKEVASLREETQGRKIMKTEKALGFGALAAGGLASLCCLGPLAFAALGLGAFGAGAFFESARPVLAVVLAVSGLSGLVLAHRKQEVACDDGSCRMGSASRGAKALLWIVIGLGAFLYATPYFL